MKHVARIALIVALLIGGMVRSGWCQNNAEEYVEKLNMKTIAAINKGDYRQGIILAEQARNYATQHLGSEHKNTLAAINNLAALYYFKGHYSEAESLYKHVLRLNEKILGKEHPGTLSSMNNLALLYKAQGRYSEAEPLLKRLFKLNRNVFGKNHPNTLASINNLATLYSSQDRYSEAEPLYQLALQLSEKVLGKEHPHTIASISNLAHLYQKQGRYSKAKSLHKIALQLSKKVSGEENPDTIGYINSLALIYQIQGHYSEAEPLYKEVIDLTGRILGKDHPDILSSINNLAALYYTQGYYSKAAPLFKQALQLSEKVLGKEHPGTLATQRNYIYLLVGINRLTRVSHLLQDQESRLLARSFQELYASSSENVRRLYLQSMSKFQRIVFSLAQQHPGEEYQRYAAEVMLRWKQVYADESHVQHRLLTLNNDAESAKIKAEIAASQAKLSQALHQQKEILNIPELIEKANQDETALLALARHLRTGLEVKDVTLDKVLAALPQDSGLIEYRLFAPADFKTGKAGKLHLAALLLFADPKAKQRFLFRDLGPLAEIEKHLKEETAEAYKRLLGPFDEQIKKLKQIYIAPDGPLNLLSFASLRLPDGRFLAERQQINQLQTGRDLIENSKDFPRGKGLVAIGGAKYGSMPAGKTEPAQTLVAYQQRAVRELAEGIQYLKESRKEAEEIFKKHGNNPEDLLLIGDDASEYSLKHLKQPPRILHLSTHGFYLGDDKKEDGLTEQLRDEAPLLLSGLALAGANNGLQGKLDQHGDDGLLYSLEVLGLNLHGTELVSLSACDTGKGVVDYSEGVYGLVRAFRTAGAKNVLMTLTPVGDASSRDFMETFYDKWLSSEKSISPAEALHQTRLQFIRNKKPTKDWAPFVLVGK